MDALEFLTKHGWNRMERVAKAAGTNRAYMSQIAHGHRRPSYDLAVRLHEESGGEMDVAALMGRKADVRH
jgi:transcriptional regulator with XRE-family HTH domain